MKNFIIFLVIILALAGAYFLITTNNESGQVADEQGTEQTNSATRTFTFVSGEERATIEYDDAGDNAELTLGEETYELERIVSASGARYLNSDETVEYWEHQGTATIRVNDEVVFEGELLEEAPTRDPSLDTREELEGTAWQWKETIYNNDEVVTPNQPEEFVLSFAEDNRFSATTDCNGLGGNYTVTDSSISFDDIVSTKMYCEDSQEDVFLDMLSSSINYINTGEGELALMLEMDTGSVIFTPVTETE